VVNPGEPLMDLVPRDQPLVIEARVSPKDIDVVYPGLKADIHLSALNARHLARVQGEVTQVSADRLTDQKTGEPYYTAQIQVDLAEIQKKTPEVKLSPGMPAEAMIITGQRTTLDYLIEPIRSSFRRALRET
jgi:HlyD family type I secretion membrane fusion protein